MGILKLLEAVSKGVLKQDDAVKKIVDMGYPESVAKRIASGELPMDEASRMARAKNQKRIDTFHASKQDFDEFKAGYSDDMAFTTPDSEFANNWLGKGKYQERLGASDEIDQLRKQQRNLRASFFDYDELDRISKEGTDAEWRAAYDRMQQSYKDAVKNDVLPDRVYDTIYPMMPKAEKTFDPRTDYEKIIPVLEKSIGSVSDDTINALKRGDYLWYESKDVADWLRANGYDSILLSESGGDITTLASLYPKTMRSKFAAFDDEYKGSSILGSAAPIAAGTLGAGTLGSMLFGSNDAEASPISFVAKSMKKIDDEIAKYEEIAEQYREYLPNAKTASPGEILREVDPQYSKYYQELKQMKNTAPLRSDTENIRSVNDIIKNKSKNLPSAAIGTGALGGMSPEEQLFAAPRQPEMRAIGSNDTPAQARTRDAVQTLGDILRSGDSPDIVSTTGAGEVLAKIANGQPISIWEALEVSGQVDPMQYPAIFKALWNYKRQQ